MKSINHIEQVREILRAGKEPTSEQLGEALAQSIRDLNSKDAIINDMTNWLGRLSSAHLHKDAVLVKSILDEFIQEKVKVVVVGSTVNIH